MTTKQPDTASTAKQGEAYPSVESGLELVKIFNALSPLDRVELLRFAQKLAAKKS